MWTRAREKINLPLDVLFSTDHRGQLINSILANTVDAPIKTHCALLVVLSSRVGK